VMPSRSDAESFDPNLVVHQMEAWMPDAIASYKLRGFVQDHEGQVLESAPGKIRVRLGGNGDNGGGWAWLGMTRRSVPIDVELRLERVNPLQQSQLLITVVMSSPDQRQLMTAPWRERCAQIFCDLRAYLCAASV
jgi:eukaryotic-like serine/threonine-protein kinase